MGNKLKENTPKEYLELAKRLYMYCGNDPDQILFAHTRESPFYDKILNFAISNNTEWHTLWWNNILKKDEYDGSVYISKMYFTEAFLDWMGEQVDEE